MLMFCLENGGCVLCPLVYVTGSYWNYSNKLLWICCEPSICYGLESCAFLQLVVCICCILSTCCSSVAQHVDNKTTTSRSEWSSALLVGIIRQQCMPRSLRSSATEWRTQRRRRLDFRARRSLLNRRPAPRQGSQPLTATVLSGLKASHIYPSSATAQSWRPLRDYQPELYWPSSAAWTWRKIGVSWPPKFEWGFSSWSQAPSSELWLRTTSADGRKPPPTVVPRHQASDRDTPVGLTFGSRRQQRHRRRASVLRRVVGSKPVSEEPRGGRAGGRDTCRRAE